MKSVFEYVSRPLIMPLALIGGLIFFSTVGWSWMSEDYYQAGSNMYVCSSTAPTTAPSTAGASVSSRLALWNASTSTVKAVLLETTAEFVASPAAAAGVFLAFNVVPSTGIQGTAGTLTSAFVGKSTSTLSDAKLACYVGATLPSVPIAFRWIGGTVGASAISGSTMIDRPANDVVIPPGGVISLQTTSSAQIVGSFTWLELPR